MADHNRYRTTAERYMAEPHTFDTNLVPTVFDDAGNAYKRFGDGSYIPWMQPAYHEPVRAPQAQTNMPHPVGDAPRDQAQYDELMHDLPAWNDPFGGENPQHHMDVVYEPMSGGNQLRPVNTASAWRTAQNDGASDNDDSDVELDHRKPPILPPLKEAAPARRTAPRQPKVKSSITKAVRAAAGKPGAIAQARVAGRKEGVPNYTVAEMELINEVVRLFLPSGFGAWERVEPEYNRMAAGRGFPSRSAVSLRRKFDSMVAMKKPTGRTKKQPYIEKAKELAKKISRKDEKTGYDSSQQYMDSDDELPQPSALLEQYRNMSIHDRVADDVIDLSNDTSDVEEIARPADFDRPVHIKSEHDNGVKTEPGSTNKVELKYVVTKAHRLPLTGSSAARPKPPSTTVSKTAAADLGKKISALIDPDARAEREQQRLGGYAKVASQLEEMRALREENARLRDRIFNLEVEAAVQRSRDEWHGMERAKGKENARPGPSDAGPSSGLQRLPSFNTMTAGVMYDPSVDDDMAQ